jgi:hypothetical protein
VSEFSIEPSVKISKDTRDQTSDEIDINHQNKQVVVVGQTMKVEKKRRLWIEEPSAMTTATMPRSPT